MDEDRIVLQLPGMTLNTTIFPDLGERCIGPDFNRLVVGSDGTSPELLRRRMGFYSSLLDSFLDQTPEWRAPTKLIVAHSFGGMLALWWLADQGTESATQISGLVLIATTAGPMYDQLSLRLGGMGSEDLRFPGGSLIHLWNHELVTRAVKRLMCGGTTETENIDFQKLKIQSDLDLDAAGWRNTDWRAMRSYRLAMEGFDVRDRLGKIELPTIVLHGARDSLFSVQAARDLANGLPNGRLRVIEGAGHALPLTHGGEVVRAIGDLVR